VDAYRALTQAYASKVGAQAEQARVEVARYQALISAKGLEWDGWKARLSAATARAESAARQSSILVDGYRVGATAAEAQATSYARRWEAEQRQYEASMNLTYQVARTNNDAVIHTNDARMEAAKVGLTAKSQQLASAWAMVGAQAQISGAVTMSGQIP
jgi:hypothetical protein